MIPFKQTKKNILVEIIIVVLTLSILSPLMFSKFLQSQEMAKIKQYEEELKKALAEYEDHDNHYRKILLRGIKEHPKRLQISIATKNEIEEFIPKRTFAFDIDEEDRFGVVYLGMNYEPNPDELTIEKEYPIGVFIALSYGDELLVNAFHWAKVPVKKPKQEAYFAVSNGLSSKGIIYIDNQGRSWRDRQ